MGSPQGLPRILGPLCHSLVSETPPAHMATLSPPREVLLGQDCHTNQPGDPSLSCSEQSP